MTDPRNPERPEGDEGSNWVSCPHCDRGAHHVKDIRHSKRCPWRADPALPVLTPFVPSFLPRTTPMADSPQVDGKKLATVNDGHVRAEPRLQNVPFPHQKEARALLQQWRKTFGVQGFDLPIPTQGATVVEELHRDLDIYEEVFIGIDWGDPNERDRTIHTVHDSIIMEPPPPAQTSILALLALMGVEP